MNNQAPLVSVTVVWVTGAEERSPFGFLSFMGSAIYLGFSGGDDSKLLCHDCMVANEQQDMRNLQPRVCLWADPSTSLYFAEKMYGTPFVAGNVPSVRVTLHQGRMHCPEIVFHAARSLCIFRKKQQNFVLGLTSL